MIRVLNDFGFVSMGLEAEDFNAPAKVIQLGVEPLRIDVLTSRRNSIF